MRVIIIDNHTKYLEELCSLFSDVVVVEKGDLKPNPDQTAGNLLVLSGGLHVPTALRHPDEYADEVSIIRNVKMPILGICLGMEIITQAFGGELRELPSEQRGIIRLQIEDEKLRSFIAADTLEVVEGHHIGVKNLPPDFISCARSRHGVEIMKHKEKPIIGFQFHPEVSKNTKLIEWMIDEFNLDSAILRGNRQRA